MNTKNMAPTAFGGVDPRASTVADKLKAAGYDEHRLTDLQRHPSWKFDSYDALVATCADHENRIFLRHPVPANILQELFLNQTVSIWQYAAGDHLEVARIASRP